jgi:hypothetical protein
MFVFRQFQKKKQIHEVCGFECLLFLYKTKNFDRNNINLDFMYSKSLWLKMVDEKLQKSLIKELTSSLHTKLPQKLCIIVILKKLDCKSNKSKA